MSLVEKGLLVHGDKREECLFRLKRVVIEITSHCNCRCKYCPQSVVSKPSGFMDDDFFRRILERLPSENPDWIALSHYGESLLDLNIKNKLMLLKEFGLSYLFLTNATLLDEAMIDFMGDITIHSAYFNFPSLEKEEWASFMGIKESLFESTRNAISRFISEFDKRTEEIGIVVNGVSPNLEERTRRISDYFAPFGKVNVMQCASSSRAGAVENEYVQKCHYTQERFYGCDYTASLLNISLDGMCYLCCHDYHQKIFLGDFMTQSITEIMQSESMNSIRAQIYGIAPMGSQFICRSCTRIRNELDSTDFL